MRRRYLMKRITIFVHTSTSAGEMPEESSSSCLQICDFRSILRAPVDRACISGTGMCMFLFMMRTEIFLCIPQTSLPTRPLHECSRSLRERTKMKVQNALVGGGFGGKEDMTVQHLSALLTYVTKEAGENEALKS